jgi:hypothetical protein
MGTANFIKSTTHGGLFGLKGACYEWRMALITSSYRWILPSLLWPAKAQEPRRETTNDDERRGEFIVRLVYFDDGKLGILLGNSKLRKEE